MTQGPAVSTFDGVGGTPITYDTYEPEGELRGVALVAHGVAEYAGRYGHVAARLVGLGLRVVVPDHRGHGRSGGRRLVVRDLSEFTTDLETLRRRVAVPGVPTYLIGHSMGGCIALDHALEHQDELDGLVLSAPAVLPGDDIKPVMMRLAKVLGRIVPALPGQKLSSAAISRDPAVVAAYDADPLVHRGALTAGIGGAMLRTMETFPSRLPSLQLPLLVLTGTADTLVRPEGAALVERLAGSRDKTLKTYTGLFHEVFNEPEQEQVLGDLVDWLRARLEA
jgi:alpha-beta hydrolase superfamily lysophospholipase